MIGWKCFAIMDKKIGAFERPFFAKHVAEVTRSMESVISQGEMNWAKHPGDFALYLIGVFDDVSGEFSSIRPEHLLEVSNLVPQRGGNNG